MSLWPSLCVPKMPFIPPVSIARSVSGLTGKESVLSASSMNRLSREERGGSVKERITINLKKMGKTEQRGTGGAAKGGVESRRRDKIKTPKQADTIITAGAGEGELHRVFLKGSVKAVGSGLRSRLKDQEEEAHFTLTLTPEAVLLLQRRSTERPPKASCGGAAEARPNGRRRDNPPKRAQQGQNRHSASSHRVSSKVSTAESEIDLHSILKVSLLNDRHKYDDVEYEEEQYGLDQRVVLKCTEWLRGLESPLTGTGTSVGEVGVWKASAKN
ncbi:hypothetical protein NQD34_000710 [Periophthalmus magnuspinnatus]|nr:hypothetical protein NQD34_000710 [Periophthalmus magnuspinnatus]